MKNNHFINEDVDDILHQIRFEKKKRLELFFSLPHNLRAQILLRLSRRVLGDLLSRVPDDELLPVLEHLDPDEATDVLQTLPSHRQKKILLVLSDNLKRDVEILSRFDPQTAAGIMNLDYIQVDENDRMSEVAKRFKTHEKKTGRLPAIIVMRNGKVGGYLPGHELGFGRPNERLGKYVRRIHTIKHDASHKEVLSTFKEHPHNKLVVTGEEENILGIIYSDDILRILQKQESASLYDFAGVHDEEAVYDDAMVKVKFRYKWLIINLGTAFLAAFTVGLFDETISKYVLLAVYMPIVAGMGGNAATQTLAVIVRGIALRQIQLKNSVKTLLRELGAGFVNGLINGGLAIAVVAMLSRDLKIAIILALAIIINLLVASFFGTVVPLIMKRLGKDPATSAIIFITTATDTLGFLIFLGLATLILT